MDQQFQHLNDTCSCSGKQCSKCSVLLCCLSFNRARNKSGLYSYCRSCQSEYKKKHYRNHAEEHKQYAKEYHQKHRDEILPKMKAYRDGQKGLRSAKFKEWYRNHQEYMQSYNKVYRQKHLEHIRRRHAEYARQNKEKVDSTARKWREARAEHIREQRRVRYESRAEEFRQWRRDSYKANPEYYRAISRKWAKNHPESRRRLMHTRRARIANAEGSYTLEEWQELKRFYDYRCLCCGQQEPDISLTVDHVQPITRGGSNFIDNIQPLCHSCNASKGTRHIDYRTKNLREEGA